MNIIFALLLSTFVTHADPITEECRLLAKKEALKSRGVSSSELNIRMALNPELRYQHEESVRVCVASKVKMAFYSNANAKLCPKSKTKYKMECFREWVSAQPIGFSTQIVQLSATAADIANLDRENEELKQDVILPMLLDSILISIEKFSSAHTQIAKNAKAEELVKLQEQERKMFSKAKLDLIPLMESQIKKMSEAAALEPAADGKTQDWLATSIRALQTRVDKVKLKQI
jgi:hypothetical protein